MASSKAAISQCFQSPSSRSRQGCPDLLDGLLESLKAAFSQSSQSWCLPLEEVVDGAERRLPHGAAVRQIGPEVFRVCNDLVESERSRLSRYLRE